MLFCARRDCAGGAGPEVEAGPEAGAAPAVDVPNPGAVVDGAAPGFGAAVAVFPGAAEVAVDAGAEGF